MSHIDQKTSLHLKKLVKEFLTSIPITESKDPNERSRGLYANILGQMFSTFCSSPPLMFTDVELPGKSTIFSESDEQLKQRIAIIRNLKLPPKTKKDIKETLRKKRGISIVYMGLSLKEAGHATLIVFDGSTGKQHFFDPHGFHKHWLQQTMAQNPPLVEGFKVASVEEDSWPRVQSSIQYQFDKAVSVVHAGGNCGLWCVLVASLCLRFGVGDPKFMASLFMDVYRNSKVVITTRLWTWVKFMEDPVAVMAESEVNSRKFKEARGELTRIVFRPESTRQCGVYCPKSGKVCSRNACGEDVFCWQHRFTLRNKDKRGKNKRKCSTPQAECRKVQEFF